MKLYNIYQNIILEEILIKVQLTENVPVELIDKLLAGEPKGKYYHVSFDYPNRDGSISNRYVKIHQRNISTIGNNLIDAYQVSKNNQSEEGWKKFNLAKMSNFKVSKIPFYQPNFGFNRTGNNSSTVSATPTIAPFDYEYATSTIKKGEKTQQTLFPKVGSKSQNPTPKAGPSFKPTKNPQLTTNKQQVRPMKRIQPKPVEPIEPEEDDENNLNLNK